MINEKHLLSGERVRQITCTKNQAFMPDGKPSSIVLHYTGSGNAEETAEHLCREDVKSSAHIVIARNGEIIQMIPFNKVAWHAGESKSKTRGNYNAFSIGIELENAGKLVPQGDHYAAWFGKQYGASEVLCLRGVNPSMLSFWHAYTEEQMKACFRLCMELVRHYGIAEIVGHQEIAPVVKMDPGPAFPLHKFRDRILNGRMA
jgi:N-acetylmuramoyl-L-alanine amidase